MGRHMLAAYSLRMNPMDLVWPISAAAKMPNAGSAESAGAFYATAAALARAWLAEKGRPCKALQMVASPQP